MINLNLAAAVAHEQRNDQLRAANAAQLATEGTTARRHHWPMVTAIWRWITNSISKPQAAQSKYMEALHETR